VHDELVYPRERTLGTVTLVLGLLVWLLIIVGTVGIALVYLLIGFLFYLFAHSALIAWLRGNGVLLSAQQMPDLRERFDACCARLGLDGANQPRGLPPAGRRRAERVSRPASSAAITSSCSPTSSTRCRRTPTASTSTSATSSATCE
jgi:hypothetical protein